MKGENQTPNAKIKQRDLVSFGFSELKEISYTSAKNDSIFFVNFLKRLSKLCQLEWSQLYITGRHSFGTETISVDNLKESARNLIPDGMTKLIVLRTSGNNHSFLGYRDKSIFQIMFIEYNFGDVYEHN